MVKVNYKQLFSELYDLFVEKGDNDVTWYKIFKRLEDDGYISQIYHSSRIHYSLYNESKSDVLTSIVVAFRKYDPNNSKKASLYTFVTLLVKQAICRFISDTCKQDRIFNTANNDYSEYENDHYVESFDDTYVTNETQTGYENTIKQMANIVIRNDIYREVFYTKNGLFGYDKFSRKKDIAKYLGLTDRTVEQACADNNHRMFILNKWLKEGNDLNALTEEEFKRYKYEYYKVNRNR